MKKDYKEAEKDYKEALKFSKSAEQGNSAAQNYLGNCYLQGNGVKKDMKEAVKWFSKSAEQGDSAAQNCLGNCYLQGIGVKKDIKEAVKWFSKSAAGREEGAIMTLFISRAVCGKGALVIKAVPLNTIEDVKIMIWDCGGPPPDQIRLSNPISNNM